MSFNSYIFCMVYLPVVVALYTLLLHLNKKGWALRFLLGSSIVFYLEGGV